MGLEKLFNLFLCLFLTKDIYECIIYSRKDVVEWLFQLGKRLKL